MSVNHLWLDSKRSYSGSQLIYSHMQCGRCVCRSLHVSLQKVRSGEWKGYTGKSMTDVVNVGIGGSDLVNATCLILLKNGKTSSPLNVFVSSHSWFKQRT